MSRQHVDRGVGTVAVLLLAAVHAERAAAQQTGVAAPTAAELAAAFPALEMEARHMMIEDPFETLVLLDRLEAQGGEVASWDLKAWAGRDLDKLVVRSEGERASGQTSHADVELLWARAIGPWWDVVAGLRHDIDPGRSRDWAAIGLQGVAPYEFDVEATAYLGEAGQMSMRFEAEYELLLTQRWILQPVVELDWYRRDDPERALGSGWSSLELGLRLRYEIRREVAPYVGIVYVRKLGDTATFAQMDGHDDEDTRFVAGLRVWF
jgi:copper resistance protein B